MLLSLKHAVAQSSAKGLIKTIYCPANLL